MPLHSPQASALIFEAAARAGTLDDEQRDWIVEQVAPPNRRQRRRAQRYVGPRLFNDSNARVVFLAGPLSGLRPWEQSVLANLRDGVEIAVSRASAELRTVPEFRVEHPSTVISAADDGSARGGRTVWHDNRRILLEHTVGLIITDLGLRAAGLDVVIVINRQRHVSRQRFTLAHEIGHLVLTHPDLRLGALRRRLGLTDAERFCNDFAARVLLPWPCVRRVPRDPDLELLVELAGYARVSLAAAMLRLRDTASWRTTMLRWRRTEGRWDPAARVAVPKVLQAHLVTGESLQGQLDSFASGSSRARMVELNLGRTWELRTVRVQARRQGDSILALADLRAATAAEERRIREEGPCLL